MLAMLVARNCLAVLMISMAIVGCSDSESGGSEDDDGNGGSDALDLDAKLYTLVSDGPFLEMHTTAGNSTVLVNVIDGKCGGYLAQYDGARTGNAEDGYSMTTECLNPGPSCEYGQTWNLECAPATSTEELICGAIVFRVKGFDACPD
jgi:hypothetical protein